MIEVNPQAVTAFGTSRYDLIGEIFLKTIVAMESRKKAVSIAVRTLNGEIFRDI